MASLILQFSWTEEFPSLHGVCLPSAHPFWHTAAVALAPAVLFTLSSRQLGGGQASCSSYQLLVHVEPPGKRGTMRKYVEKWLEPKLRKHSSASSVWFLMVLQGHVMHSVGCAHCFSTANQTALGCHHFAVTAQGRSFIRTTFSFISLPHFSPCPFHGYFHPSRLWHTRGGSRCDKTTLTFWSSFALPA